jgi:hypothetical protein
MDRERRTLLIAFAGSGLALLAVTQAESAPSHAAATVLLGAWLLSASVILLAHDWRLRRAAAGLPFIPLRFAGSTGRYRLMRSDDGRTVDIVAGRQVVAEVRATDLRDEIDLDPEPILDADLDELGTALGRAIVLAAEADEEQAALDPRPSQPSGSEPRRSP